jgi:hypothetical protein
MRSMKQRIIDRISAVKYASPSPVVYSKLGRVYVLTHLEAVAWKNKANPRMVRRVKVGRKSHRKRRWVGRSVARSFMRSSSTMRIRQK